jgi:hypothetical protein
MMANAFNITLDDKPALTALKGQDIEAFKEVVGTFVGLMETAAANQWHTLPDSIHTSLSFNDVVTGVLNAVMTTEQINPEAYTTLESDLHPLALLSDKRKDLISGEREVYDWKRHFSMDSNEVSKDAIEKVIRKILYLVRWFDIESVSKAMITQQFPVVDAKDIQKLPFQPALQYQKSNLGELHIGKFLHDIGALNCGVVDKEIEKCPACSVGMLENVKSYRVCPRCNAGYALTEEFEF